jgi:hypothetical protein
MQSSAPAAGPHGSVILPHAWPPVRHHQLDDGGENGSTQHQSPLTGERVPEAAREGRRGVRPLDRAGGGTPTNFAHAVGEVNAVRPARMVAGQAWQEAQVRE